MSENTSQHISDVSLLITHFNRSESLQRLLSTFKKFDVSFDEIVVSDGGSNAEHIKSVKALQEQFGFTLLTTEVNLGLGNSINVGQDAVKTPYILYIQEDFVPKAAFVNALKDGLSIIKTESEWDIVRFYSFPWSPFPYLKDYKKGFSEMKFSLWPWYISHIKFFVYSDHPHLKRKTYPEKFGRYLETRNGDVTEMSMCRTFLKKKGRGLYFADCKSLFEHDNPEEEPGLFRPEKLRTQKLAEIAPLHWMYLKFKMLKETVSYVLSK